MIVECVNNDGFEDQLGEAVLSEYEVKEIGENSYLIENDNEENRWYGTDKFRILPAESD